MDVLKLTEPELQKVVVVGRKKFMSRREGSQMADKFYQDQVISGISRDSVAEYLGNKINSLSTTQLVTAAKYIRSHLGEEAYHMLLTQCNIRYVPSQQLLSV